LGVKRSLALADMNLPRPELVQSLIGFIVGVELGQAAIVIAVLPLLLWACSMRRYETAIVPAAATCIVLVGLVWAIERAVGIDLMSRTATVLASR
jgi:hypothetical protein